MKRMVLSTLTMLALTTGVAFAQGPNTTPPGPTQQQEPGLTSNNLPNPGNPQTQVGNQQPVMEEGTVEGTATESINNADQSNTTGRVTGSTTTTGTMLQNEPEEGMDVDVDAGANANGAVDVDVNSTSDADTDASGINETGESSDSLPATGSELPLLGLMGLLALGAAFVVRRF